MSFDEIFDSTAGVYFYFDNIVGGCELYKEERNDLGEEMKKTDKCDMEKFGTSDSSEKAIAILGDNWWPQTAKEEGDKTVANGRSMFSEKVKFPRLCFVGYGSLI